MEETFRNPPGSFLLWEKAPVVISHVQTLAKKYSEEEVSMSWQSGKIGSDGMSLFLAAFEVSAVSGEKNRYERTCWSYVLQLSSTPFADSWQRSILLTQFFSEIDGDRPPEVPGPQDRRQSAAASVDHRMNCPNNDRTSSSALGLQTGRSKGSILTEIGWCTSPGSVKKMPQIWIRDSSIDINHHKS